MSQSHSHAHSQRVNASKSGPSQMATTQEEFRREVVRRFRVLRGALRKTLVDNDFLLLQEDTGPQSPRDLVNVDPADPYDFPTGNREEAFNRWFRGAIDEGVFEPLDRDNVIRGQHWTAPYTESGYNEGLSWADKQLKSSGIDVEGNTVDVITQLPQHQRALETVYSRSYRQLDGITSDMESDIARILSDGMAGGDGARSLADDLNREIQSFERVRANAFARTETMNAHARATGERFKQYGVSKVSIITHSPCDLCANFRDEGPHDVETAQKTIPLHPNCVCAMTIYIENTNQRPYNHVQTAQQVA